VMNMTVTVTVTIKMVRLWVLVIVGGDGVVVSGVGALTIPMFPLAS
jgi:hypothetical protein